MSSSPKRANESNAAQTEQEKEKKSGRDSTNKKEVAQTDGSQAVLATYGYTMGDTIGKGSYAVVKVAYSKKLRKQIAIKIVTKKRAPVDYLTKFLPREIQVMKHIDHANVVGLHEAIETNTRIYLIIDFADGGDLLDYIKNNSGPIPEHEGREIFQQLIDATEYIHSRGIVHRDLKCENILLTNDKKVMLSDFGFARLQPIQPETGTRKLSMTFCGSYAYAPPEILRGIAYDGTRADIWSLGAVLYTMLCACLPFDDSNLKLLLEQVTKPVVFHRKRKVSDEARDLINRMLCCDVNARIGISGIRSHPWYPSKKLTEAEASTSGGNTIKSEEQGNGSKDSGIGNELHQGNRVNSNLATSEKTSVEKTEEADISVN